MKILISVIIGLLAGMFIMYLYFRSSLSKTLMMENESRYGFVESEQVLREKAQAAGWKILGTHDLQEKMAANGFEIIEAKVFDLCRPEHASKILQKDEERIVSPLLPCRIAIYKRSNGKTYISRMNSLKMAGYMPGIVPEVMGKAAVEIEDILAPLIR